MIKNSAPHEVMAAPFTLFWAPLGAAFPALGAALATVLAAGWVRIGKSGPLNYDRATGLIMAEQKTVVQWRSAGDTGVRKNFLTESGRVARLTLVDLTLEQVRLALNMNPVTVLPGDSGGPGRRKIGLSPGVNLTTIQLLARADMTPYQEEGSSQYEMPFVQEIGSSEIPLTRPGEPAAVSLEFMALVDPDAVSEDESYGRLIMQDDSAGVVIVSSSEANPSVITTAAPHGFETDDSVVIAGHTSTPDINGAHTVTVLSATTFSIPEEVTVAGAGGVATLAP